MPTRMCQYCRRQRPSETSICITEHFTRDDGTTHSRNFYYCDQCYIYGATECMCCGTPGRQASYRYVGHDISRRLGQHLEDQGIQTGRRYVRMPNEQMPSRRSDFICPTCSILHGIWACTSCTNNYSPTLGDQRHTLPSAPDTPYCTPCFSRFTPCVKCKQPVTDPRTGRTPANTHQHTHGYLCSTCTRTRSISQTFDKNPYPQLCGYEIEFIMPMRCVDNLRLHTHGIIKYDGSIHAQDLPGVADGWQGWEFNSFPANGDELFKSLEYVIAAINDAGGLVNRSCGIHFHFDMSSVQSAHRDNFIRWWRIFEPVLFDLVTASRRNNRYCGRGADGDRYRALNWRHAFAAHHTFEVRMHHATLDFKEVWSFCHMLLSMFAVLPQTDIPTELMDGLAISESELTKRERALLLFQQCAFPLSMRKSIMRRIHTINSRQYRTHHWRKPKKAKPEPIFFNEPPPPTYAYTDLFNRLTAIHGRA